MTVWIRNWFSNMLECDNPIVDEDGISYLSVENYYQANKSTSIEDKKFISSLTPRKSKSAGRKLEIRKDWTSIKDNIMRAAVYKKFAVGTSWAQKLLATNNEHIVETNNWHDNYWGNCICEKCINIEGKNKLGKILITTRYNLWLWA